MKRERWIEALAVGAFLWIACGQIALGLLLRYHHRFALGWTAQVAERIEQAIAAQATAKAAEANTDETRTRLEEL